MSDAERIDLDRAQIDRLAREIEEAELFLQKLRGYIAAIRDELADGHAGRALSMCNQALTEFDDATDVVAPSPRLKEAAGLAADGSMQSGERAADAIR